MAHKLMCFLIDAVLEDKQKVLEYAKKNWISDRANEFRQEDHSLTLADSNAKALQEWEAQDRAAFLESVYSNHYLMNALWRAKLIVADSYEAEFFEDNNYGKPLALLSTEGYFYASDESEAKLLKDYFQAISNDSRWQAAQKLLVNLTLTSELGYPDLNPFDSTDTNLRKAVAALREFVPIYVANRQHNLMQHLVARYGMEIASNNTFMTNPALRDSYFIALEDVVIAGKTLAKGLVIHSDYVLTDDGVEKPLFQLAANEPNLVKFDPIEHRDLVSENYGEWLAVYEARKACLLFESLMAVKHMPFSPNLLSPYNYWNAYDLRIDPKAPIDSSTAMLFSYVKI